MYVRHIFKYHMTGNNICVTYPSAVGIPDLRACFDLTSKVECH